MDRRVFLAALSGGLSSGCLRLTSQGGSETTTEGALPTKTTSTTSATTETSATTTGTETTDATETTGETETTETPPSSVDVEYATNRLATGDSPNYVSSWLSVAFSPSVEIDDRTSFEITNADTGRSVTVSVTSNRSAVGRNVALIVYDYEGRLRDGNEVVSVTPPYTHETVRLDATVEGDAATFSEQTFAGYKVTMSKQGTVVGSTGVQEYATGHPKEFASSVENGTLEWSFDAGELPSDANRTAWIQTDEGTVDASEVGYDAAANRFVASVSTDRVPEGSHTAVIRLRDSETGVYLVRLAGTVTV